MMRFLGELGEKGIFNLYNYIDKENWKEQQKNETKNSVP
jgi:hypothetical protein